jgi:hypothetical protein
MSTRSDRRSGLQRVSRTQNRRSQSRSSPDDVLVEAQPGLARRRSRGRVRGNTLFVMPCRRTFVQSSSPPATPVESGRESPFDLPPSSSPPALSDGSEDEHDRGLPAPSGDDNYSEDDALDEAESSTELDFVAGPPADSGFEAELPTTPNVDANERKHEQSRGYVHHVPTLESIEDRQQARKKKKTQQVNTWSEVVIPSLIRPYLRLVRETGNLESPAPPISPPSCRICPRMRTIDVVCVYMDRKIYLMFYNALVLICVVGMDSIKIPSCAHCLASKTLVTAGLFPCAPLLPSLAVDMKMLRFVNELQVRSSPNNTAWCDALEAHLQASNFKFATEVLFFVLVSESVTD